MTGVDPFSGVKRTRVVAVRLNDVEHDALTRLARAGGRRQLGAWMREALMRMAAGPSAYPGRARPVDPVLAELRHELGRVGNNLNQAMVAAHRGPGDPAVLARLGEEVASARAVLDGLRDRLDGLGGSR